MVWTGRELLGWSTRAGRRTGRTAAGASLPKAPLDRRRRVDRQGADRRLRTDAAASFSPGHGWRAAATASASPAGATRAVWDGDELLVVGGRFAPPVGLAYSPTTNAWRELAPMDSGRKDAAAVWTGRRLILWGGETGTPGRFVIPPHGLAYDPRGRSLVAASSGAATRSARPRRRLDRPLAARLGRRPALRGRRELHPVPLTTCVRVSEP